MKAISAIIEAQLDNKKVAKALIFKINSVNKNAYLITSSISAKTEFASMSAQFTLNNNGEVFSPGGTYAIEIGDVVEYIAKYDGDATEFKRFYGTVYQRNRGKKGNTQTLTINCMDYINVLQNWDLDLKVEGTKVEITEETLSPVYLPSPNDNLSQLFNFANNGIAASPKPIIMIKDKLHSTYDPRNSKEYEIYADTGQLKLGTLINARYNYDVYCRSYWSYAKGVYVEDVLEEIITQPNGYGDYLFGEANATDLINNHLKDTFNNVTGKSSDTLLPNLSVSTIVIEHKLSEDVSEADTSITVSSVEGLPSSGEGSINGDVFTWTGVESGTTLTGIPSSGSYSLKAHTSDNYASYSNTYDRGRVWYLKFTNVQTDMDAGDFTLPSGSSLDYFDKRFGRIILDAAVDVDEALTCDTDYTFKTLQASSIEINSISFNSRELANRLEAIKKLFSYLAPNYLIRTIGDNKIWSGYVRQRTVADYTLKLRESTQTLEDEDLYTRVILYATNEAPSNIMFKDGVDFLSTGESYKAIANLNLLNYNDDLDEEDYYVFETTISGGGYINLEDVKPLVYINSIPIDDTLNRMIMQPVQTLVTTRTVTRSGCHGISKESYTKIHNYYYYEVYFSHTNIEPSRPIYLYNASGEVLYTLSANDSDVNYAAGIWKVPGENVNSVVEQLSTATYHIFYSTKNLVIDYDNIRFKIHKSILPNPTVVTVHATFEYWAVFIPIHDVAAIKDGRWDTQAQMEFYSEPPSGYNLAIIDLGATYTIQAVDITAGFFIPDGETIERRIDSNNRLSLQYSLNGTDYYEIASELNNFALDSGEAKSFEESDLGIGFEARYFKLISESASKIEFKNGVWVVAISEFAVYGDLVLKSEIQLIPTTYLSNTVVPESGTFTIDVDSTSGFDSSGDAYIRNIFYSFDGFSYTGITATSFTGCSGLSDAHAIDDMLVQEMEADDTVYDVDGLLPKLGDRIFKENVVNSNQLYNQSSLDWVGKAWLQEFIKNHNKKTINIIYSPHLIIGDTVYLEDEGLNYFIEAISENNGRSQLILARYP